MALDTSKISLNSNIIIHVKLTGKTLYFADRNISLDDGNWYDGRLKVSGRLSERFQSLIEPQQLASTFKLGFDNGDGGLNADLTSYVWGNRDVNVYAGEGTALADYSLIFAGFVKYPNGITRSDTEISMTVSDAIERDKIKVPSEIYTSDEFPNLDSVFAGIHKPILYGDFTASPTQATQAVCIDTSTNLFEAAPHEIGGIGQVFVNSVAVAHSQVSLDPGRYTITTYVASSDLVTNRCFGKPGVGVDLSGSTQMTHPVDQLYDFMINESEIPAARIDKPSFVSVKDIDTSQAARRFLNKQRSSIRTMSEVNNEFSYDMFVVGGCYTLGFREPGGADGQILDTSDYITGSLNAVEDPDLTMADKIQFFYNYDPITSNFNKAQTLDGLTAMVAAGATIERELPMYWQFTDVDAKARAARELMTFQAAPEIVSGDFTIRSMLLNLRGDVVITLPGYNDTNMQIRGMAKDWNKLNNRLTLWNVPSFKDVGRWTSPESFTGPGFGYARFGEAKFGEGSDIEPTPYYSYTYQQQQEFGFWLSEDSTVGTCYLSDLFTADDGTILSNHKMTIGPYWKEDFGTTKIISNHAVPQIQVPRPGQPFFHPGVQSLVGTTLTEYTIQADFTVGTTGLVGFIFRYVDPANYGTVYASPAAITCLLAINDTFPGTYQGGDIESVSNPFQMKMVVTNEDYKFYKDGVYSTAISKTNSINSAGATIGIILSNDEDQVDNLLIEAVEGAPTNSYWY